MATAIDAFKPIEPLVCKTCGAMMELRLIGEVNKAYVTLCGNVAVKHPVVICTPTMVVNE